jgi:hypothetical protein
MALTGQKTAVLGLGADIPQFYYSVRLAPDEKAISLQAARFLLEALLP